MLNRKDALTGVLVADAAALGLHWMYDQEQIARIETTGSILFRQPDVNVYVDRKAYFAHQARAAGQLSHYGESARLVGEVCRAGSYSTAEHRASFMSSFGPCGSFVGYADLPTKALILRMLADVDEVQDPSGIDDDQHPGLCPIAATFAHDLPLQTALAAVQVISTNQQVKDCAQILYTCLENIMNGADLNSALETSANGSSGPLGELLQQSQAMTTYQPLEAATRFGLACHIPQGLPLVWHILNHVDSFEAAVRDNIRCGGDSCGRSMMLGALAGVAFGVPEHLLERLNADIQ